MFSSCSKESGSGGKQFPTIQNLKDPYRCVSKRKPRWTAASCLTPSDAPNTAGIGVMLLRSWRIEKAVLFKPSSVFVLTLAVQTMSGRQVAGPNVPKHGYQGLFCWQQKHLTSRFKNIWLWPRISETLFYSFCSGYPFQLIASKVSMFKSWNSRQLYICHV